jgi:DNA-binding NtrC family response regulator
MLVVDDEESVAWTYSQLFERDGYRVTTALSAADALRHLNNGQAFDVVVTDLRMERPEAGLDVARAAKKLKPAPIIVVCTGFANIENARRALDIHIDYLAVKPVDLDGLRTALARLLARRQVLGEGKK